MQTKMNEDLVKILYQGTFTYYPNIADKLETYIEGKIEQMSKETLTLTLEEIQAVQKILGYILYHTSPELYSVAGKLEKLSNPDIVDYDDVVFFKNDEGGSPNRAYKHRNISIAIQ